MLVFAEEGKPESPDKNRPNRVKNQHQLNPLVNGSGNRTWATKVRGECAHRFAKTLLCGQLSSYRNSDRILFCGRTEILKLALVLFNVLKHWSLSV